MHRVFRGRAVVGKKHRTPHVLYDCDELKTPNAARFYDRDELTPRRRQVRKQFDFDCLTECDGEVILHLYARGGIEFAAQHLDGVYAFCLLDVSQRKVFIGRDLYGVRPCFRMHTSVGFMGLSSEAKGEVTCYSWRAVFTNGGMFYLR